MSLELSSWNIQLGVKVVILCSEVAVTTIGIM